MGDPTNPLTRPLTDNEQHLLGVIGQAYFNLESGWPVWDFVERMMLRDYGVDARPVLFGLPRVKELFPIASYGLTFPTTWVLPHPIASDPNDRIGLTVAGLARLVKNERIDTRIEAVLQVVGWLAEREGVAVPNPLEPVVVTVSWSEIRRLVAESSSRHSPTWVDSVVSVLQEEAPLWGAKGRESFNLNSDLRIFRGLGTHTSDVGDYLDRIAQWIQPSRHAILHQSPLEPTSIHEALDHLDAIIRLSDDRQSRGGRALSPVGELTLPVVTRQDFEDRASALADCLAHLDVPGYDPKRHSVGPTLAELEKYVTGKVDAQSVTTVKTAIETLKAVADVRHAKEHGEATFRAPAAFLRLGISWPDTDWTEAWASVGHGAVAALRVVREELRRAG